MAHELPPLPVLPLGRYRHYKGGEYEVVGVVRHSESLEPMVLYRPLYNATGHWVRPLTMFLENVEHGGVMQPRFSLVGAGTQADAGLPPRAPETSPPHMLHHLSLGARDIERAARFYDAVLAPLGYARVWSDLRPGEQEQAVGYGPPGSGDKLAIKQVAQAVPEIPGFHVALAAPSRQAVQAFHAAALAAGGRDNGAPGLRPDYGTHYYAAFVIDPEGHRLEAVCKAPA
jgi:catechol 2,3-dioxygenase-like lactoylglutathione lyase family enzyme